MEFSFVQSTRFWVMLVGAVSVYLNAKGLIGDAEMTLVASVSALFVSIRTIDRFGEKK